MRISFHSCLPWVGALCNKGANGRGSSTPLNDGNATESFWRMNNTLRSVRNYYVRTCCPQHMRRRSCALHTTMPWNTCKGPFSWVRSLFGSSMIHAICKNIKILFANPWRWFSMRPTNVPLRCGVGEKHLPWHRWEIAWIWNNWFPYRTPNVESHAAKLTLF